jgi:hypothetical protein
MKRSTGFAWVFAAALCLGQTAFSQMHEIDAVKLPQDPGVQATYAQVGRYEKYGQTWTNKWAYDVAKADVVSVFRLSLATLTEADKKSPGNHELQMFGALVAHFAYNVDVETAYDAEVQFLKEASVSGPGDFRISWFSGMQQCQANQGAKGMPLLLGIEDGARVEELPVDFWEDYVTCATVTRMPAHSLRAIGRAVQMGAPAEGFRVLKGMNEKSFKASDVGATYSAREAWAAEGGHGDVVFTSRLCGVLFAARSSWGADIRDVAKGTCVAIFSPPAYPAKVGKSSPSVMLLSQPAEAGETLNDFVHKFLKGKSATAVAASGVRCPVTTCVAYEVSDKEMYANEGGAHLVVEAFERDMPEFDGLIFERPESPPKAGEKQNEMVYFRADEEYHRLPGKLYYLVLLDSNVSIFDAANQDYEFFLKSMRVE